ncbi:MAG: fibronectin type III domain-containing protein [Coriobacteriales bacterium]|jgi:hypothetical protein
MGTVLLKPQRLDWLLRLCAAIVCLLFASIFFCCCPQYALGDSESTSGDPLSVEEETPKLTTPSISGVSVEKSGIRLTWKKVKNADGYYVYRRAQGSLVSKLVRTIDTPLQHAWTDKGASFGVVYSYSVVAYLESEPQLATEVGQDEALVMNNEVSETTATSEERSAMRMKGPASVKISKKSKATSAKISWHPISYASDYEVQYSKNSLFKKAKKLTVSDADRSSVRISKLKKKSPYYVRVRSVAKLEDGRIKSPWSYTKNVAKTKSAKVTRLKHGKKTFELRSRAKQKVKGYDTLQGSCSDGTYGYYSLYNRNKEKCKIVKVKLSNMKVKKVSKVLAVAHCNDMTYNADDDCIVVARCTLDRKSLTLVDPKKLTVVSSVKPKLKAKALGVSKSLIKKWTGFSAIAYNHERQQYAAILLSTRDILILDRDFVPVRYIDVSQYVKNQYQGIEATDDYICVCLSPKSSGTTNMVAVFSWTGDKVGKFKTSTGGEFESVFFAGSKLYLGTYVSCIKRVVKKIKVKKTKKIKKTVKGKKRTVVKKVKVTKRVVRYELSRNNYLYRATRY